MQRAMYTTLIIVLGIGLAQAQKAVWDLSKDLIATNNQISFNQGALGVWYFLQSSSFNHDPKTYELLAAYNEACIGDSASKLIDGVSCWQNPNPDSATNRVPVVGINFTSAMQFTKNFGIPARSVFMHPSAVGLALIGWKSPITGSVNVAGRFTDIDPTCDNGVLWFIERNDQPLASGDIANGGAEAFNLTGVNVKKSQVLYFMIDPKNGDYACDTTMIELTISAL